MSTFQIRTPAPAEAAQVAAFMRTCYLAAYGHVASAEDTADHLAKAYGDELVAAGLADDTMRFLIVTRELDDGQRIDAGYAWLVKAEAPEPLRARLAVELRRFFLHPDSIGSGAAEPLMAALLDQARQWCADGVFLSVWKESPRAIRFYGRQGFRACATVHFSIGSAHYDDWLMWRTV
ncbi:MAG: GNAT family N-acetyltransferase [Ahniella sp.]|nr:GNAT family N-acetyltransferase [Ahniella sp.]